MRPAAIFVPLAVLCAGVCWYIATRSASESVVPVRSATVPVDAEPDARSRGAVQGEIRLGTKVEFDAKVEIGRGKSTAPDDALDALLAATDAFRSGDWASSADRALELAVAVEVCRSYQPDSVRVASRRLVDATGVRRAELIDALATIGGPDAASALQDVDFAVLTDRELRSVARLAADLEPEAARELKQRVRAHASPRLRAELDAPREPR